MSLETTFDFFVGSYKETILGRALPFYTIKEVAKATNKDGSNVRKDIQLLIDKGFIVEHPLNKDWKSKRYRVCRSVVKNFQIKDKNNSITLAKMINNIP